MRKHGALSVSKGFVYSGALTGQHVVVAQYESFATYGAGMASMMKDPEYQELVKEAMENFELVDRGIVITEEI